MSDSLQGFLILGAVLIIIFMPIFRSKHGRTSIVSAILQYVREEQAERRHHNELRQKVIFTVSSSFTNGESPEQLKKRLDTIAGPIELKQFGGDAFAAALNIIHQEERLSPEREASLDAVISRFDVPSETTERAGLDLRRYRVLYHLEHGEALPQVIIPGLILHKGETAHWSESGAIIEG